LIACLLLVLYKKEDKFQEVCNEIKDIISKYEHDLESFNNEIGEDDNIDNGIASGHSQVSIVTTYRLGKWRRIPLLLLAEGDIIALSAGDVAPGNVIELIPIASSSSIPVVDDTKSYFSEYRHGDSIKKGTKILLRNHTIGAQGLSSMGALPQKSMPSTSPHLLSFTGDMRCFILTETPVRAFLNNILNSSCNNVTNDDNDDNDDDNQDNMNFKNRQSYVRTVVITTLTEGFRILKLIIVLILIGAIIRLTLCDINRDDWALTLLYPLATPLLVFSPFILPLPIIYVIGESMVMGNLLATAEVILKNDQVDDSKNESNNNNNSNSNSNNNNTDNIELKNISVKVDNNTNSRKSIESSDYKGKAASLKASSYDDSDSDEFLVDDIDERAEEIGNNIVIII